MAQLTRPGLESPPEMVFDPIYGSYVPAPPKRKFYDRKEQAMAAANQALQSAQTAPNVSVGPSAVSGVTPAPEEVAAAPSSLPAVPMLAAAAANQVNPPDVQFQQDTQVTAPSPSLPKFIKPSFSDVTRDQYGNVKPIGAGTTKLGKLLQIFAGAAQGGLDAVAGGALDAVPGRSGFGAGAEAAKAGGDRRINETLARQHAGLVNEQTRANIGLLPWMKRAQIGELEARTSAEQARGEYWRSARGQKDQATLQQMHAARVAQVIAQGGDPNADPQTQQLAGAIRETLKQPGDKAETPFTVWRQQNPGKDVSEYFKLQPEARAEFREPRQPKEPKPRMGTPEQFQKLEQDKQKALASAEQMFKIDNDQEALDAAKQAAQENYETGIRNLGGNAGGGAATPAAAPAASAQNAPKQLDAPTAAVYLQRAGGDKNKARKMARADGWKF